MHTQFIVYLGPVKVQISEGAALSEAGVPTVMSMPLVVSHDSLPPKVKPGI